jgi:hypothetical protein
MFTKYLRRLEQLSRRQSQSCEVFKAVRAGLSLLLSLYLCSIMCIVPILSAGLTVTDVSILENGGFESGLSNWDLIESGDGTSASSGSFSHTGSYSLMLDLKPISMITETQIQGAYQAVSVQNLRGLSLQAWFLTPSCSLPRATMGRVVVQVEGIAVHYDTQATCGGWERITQNVTADFQSKLGSDGLHVFERQGQVSVLVALELVRSASDAMALSEYLSVYWDDVNATASIESGMSMNVTTLSTSTSVGFVETSSTAISSVLAPAPETALSTAAASPNHTGLLLVFLGFAFLSIPAAVFVGIAIILSKRRTPKGAS